MDPLDEYQANDACTWQMQVSLIPARIETARANAEQAGRAIPPLMEVFLRELLTAAREEREAKVQKIAAILRPFFSDRTDARNGEVSYPSVNIARGADQLHSIPVDRIGNVFRQGFEQRGVCEVQPRSAGTRR